MITVTLLGELSIVRDDVSLTLPSSRKARALLAYLVLSDRPHRRERLCELFWDNPDDPRAALRWSLSKLRPIVNDPAQERLAADRERVRFVASDVDIDLKRLHAHLDDDELSASRLREIVADLNQPLLDGLDLPNAAAFQAWLAAERREHESVFAHAAGRLAKHPFATAEQALAGARAEAAARPYDPEVAATLLRTLRRAGEHEEARLLVPALEARFRDAGIDYSVADPVCSEHPAGVSDNDETTFATTTNLDWESQSTLSDDEGQSEARQLLTRQTIRFCAAADGVQIAYATVGSGPPIVKAANWLSHLELDWDAPIWSPMFRELARDHTFVRYDERGNGLSDWAVDDISFDPWVSDLETVVDTLELEQFVLLGISQGAAVSIEYAARHPERVSQLILFGGYAAGWRHNGASADEVREREAIITLTKAGWGRANPAYRRIFSSSFMPSASTATLDWFDEFQRRTTSPANAARFLSAFGDIDVRDRLPHIRVPTLVVHSLADQRCPVALGREIAAAIPNAEFMGLHSDGHLLVANEPAAADFINTVRRFIGRDVRILTT